MGMSVNSNAAALSVLRSMSNTNNKMDNILLQLSTGFRINSAADGASEFSISSKLTAQMSALGAAKKNTSAATAMVKMADAGAAQIQTMVERLKVIATTAASGSSNTALPALEAERVKLEGQITKIAQGTAYNGVKLLDGTGGVNTFQVGASNNAFDQITAAFNNKYDATTLGLGVATPAAPVGGGAAPATPGTFSTQADAQAYLATIDTALNTVITQRADLGSTVNVLGYAASNLTSSIEQLTSSIGAIKNVDTAKASADLARLQVTQQIQTTMLSQANRQAQNLLGLFR